MQDITGAGDGLDGWDDAWDDADEAGDGTSPLGDDVWVALGDDEIWGDDGWDDGWDEDGWGDGVYSGGDGPLPGDDADDVVYVADPSDDAGDDYQTQAVIAVGCSVDGEIGHAYDIDLWRIDLVAGQTYSFKATAGSGIGSAYLALFDERGWFLDYDGSGDGFTFTAEDDGTFFLAVSGDWQHAGTYTLRAVQTGSVDIPGQTITGTAGDDDLSGGRGADVMSGKAGDDILDGGSGGDQVDGGAGDDVIFGGGGADQILGGAGDDILFGDGGNDVIDGGDGADLIFGDTGNDTIILGDLGDLDDWEEIDGGDGEDTLLITGSGTLDLAYHGGWSVYSLEVLDARGDADVAFNVDSYGILFTTGSDTLRLRGDAGDTLTGNLAGASVTSGADTTTYSFTVAGFGAYSLIVDNAIDRSGLIV